MQILLALSWHLPSAPDATNALPYGEKPIKLNGTPSQYLPNVKYVPGCGWIITHLGRKDEPFGGKSPYEKVANT
ncbi:hypothetical protein GGS21DRAFT_500969 [Xylaria nigripes]|nr:hypothetical protein GGS21DRAFT_500969 [Xylaria nigripes]